MTREVSLMARLTSDAIPCVYSHGTLHDGRPWIAMEHVEGPTLRAHISANGRLSPKQSWELLRPVAVALRDAHAASIIHRDLKPENVVLASRGAVVIDFGLARTVDLSDTAITVQGTALGTPAYMAPEQWWNDSVGPRADQYSLATVIYECIAGVTPFAANSAAEWIDSHLHRAPPKLPLHTPDGPKADPVLLRALAKNPSERFASLDDFIEAMDQVVDGAPHALRTSPRSSRVVLSLGLLGLCILALPITGHAGIHDPSSLFRIAGRAPMLGIFALLVAGCVSLVRDGHTARWATATALGGVLASATGWQRVLQTAAQTPAEDRFAILHEGLIEADAGRTWAAWFALGLTFATLAKNSETQPLSVLWRPLAAIQIFVLLCIFANHSSLALFALLVGTLALSCSRAKPSAGSDPRDAKSLMFLGLLFSASVCVTRHTASEAAVWQQNLARAERITRLTSLAQVRTSSAVIAGVLVIALLQWMRKREHSSRGLWSFNALTGRDLATLALAGAYLTLDIGSRARVELARAQARSEIAAQFSVISHLRPPRSPAQFMHVRPPHRWTTLQAGQFTLAIDGTRFLRTSALDQPAGRALIAAELSRRLAARESVASPGWTLLADERLPWRHIHTLAQIAQELDAGDVELLLAKDSPVTVSSATPSEALLAMPQDFASWTLPLADIVRCNERIVSLEAMVERSTANNRNALVCLDR